MALLLLAPAGGGCRTIWLGGKQDVEVVAPRGSRLFLDATPVSPGWLRLRRDRDYTLSTDWGWSQPIRSRLAWETFLWFLLADGPFELLDFIDGSAYYLDPKRIEVPPSSDGAPVPSPRDPSDGA